MKLERFSIRTIATAAVLLGFVAACKDDDGGGTEPPPPDEPAVLLAAGDISRCRNENDETTAQILDQNPDGTILTLGDNVYPEGTSPPDYAACYESAWGRHKDRTRPVLGNHEYLTGTADPTFSYFGSDAIPGRGYYSFDLGAWHIIVLDSNYPIVDTGPGSAQLEWLRQDLAANAEKKCVLAAWHHPRFYQGTTTSNLRVREFWRALESAGADVILNGHFHLYERYARLNSDGEVDPENGIRQFIVGTGGTGHDVMHPGRPGVEVRQNTAFGVLKLTLKPDGYDWQFLAEPGATFTDTGTEACH